MDASAILSGNILQRFEAAQEEAAAAAQAEREPIVGGRIIGNGPFGGPQRSEIAFERLDDEIAPVLGANFRAKQGHGWTTGPTTSTSRPAMSTGSMAPPAMTSMAGFKLEQQDRDSSFSFSSDQPEAKPLLGWYGEEAGEEGKRRIATMQARLNQRLGPEYVSSRQGPSGSKLHYLEGWKAIDLANDVFGFNGWSTNLVRLDTDFVNTAPDGRVSIGITAIMRVTLRDGTFHEDLGYGHIENAKGTAAAMEKAKKEAVTDALKRALRTFGRLVGNCVYDKRYLETVSKMRAQDSKYDVSQLHRRSDTNAPPPPPPDMTKREDESVAMTEHSLGTDESSRSSAFGNVLGPGHAPLGRSNSTIPGTAAQREGPPMLARSSSSRPSGGAVESDTKEGLSASMAQRKAAALARQKMLAEERAAAAAAAAETERRTALEAEQQTRRRQSPSTVAEGSSGSSTGTIRAQPQLRRAPPAQVPSTKPKQVGSSAAAQLYAEDPGARWQLPASTEKKAQPDHQGQPQSRPQPANASATSAAGLLGAGSLDEEELAAAFDLSQGSTGLGTSSRTGTETAPQTDGRAGARSSSTGFAPVGHRSGSAGRFLDPKEHKSAESAYGVTSLSCAASTREPNGRAATKTLSGRGHGHDDREPLREMDVDEGGSVKRQRCA